MRKPGAPKSTPSPSKGEVKPKLDAAAQRSLFLGAVLDMSWQLAIVVLVPIVGGFELDSHFKTSPLFIILGFVLAIGGVFVVLKKMLEALNQHFLHPGGKT